MSRLRLVAPQDPAVAPLAAGLRRERYPLDHGSPTDFLPPAGAFLILEEEGVTIAGGALRRLAPGVGEVKRMWTAPERRGRGHARWVLGALEEAAVRRGYHTLRLVPGTAAAGFYTAMGYAEVPGGGWFEKRLDNWDYFAADALDRGEVLVRQMLEHHPFDARLGEPA
jgi:GNAT superfamily N-acetyltransferase